MREYVLTEGQLRSLARGQGGTEAISLLTGAQMSRRLLLVLAAAERALATSPELRAVFTLMAAIDRDAPAAGRDLLRHPFLETWFNTVTSPPTSESTGYLGALAAATAVRASLPFELMIAVAGIDLVLPGLGVACGVGEGRLSIRFDGSTLALDGGGTSVTVPAPLTSATENWRPAFHVRLPTVTLEVDDVDPLRDRFPQRPLERMPHDERAGFGRSLEAAWELLMAEQPEQVAGMSVALRQLVPLRTSADGNQVSASNRVCFGAIGMSPTGDPEAIAELLLHESRHEVLDALLDLVELCRPDGPARYHAPWRSEARPAEALMQGVYAFAGVAEFWRTRRLHHSGMAARRADFTFHYWREQVEYAVSQLLAAGELTVLGRVFFTEVESVVKGWREESASAEAAWQSAVATRVGWRLSHQRVDRAEIEALSRAWQAGVSHGRRLSEPSIIDGASPGMRLSESLKDSWVAGTRMRDGATALERAIVEGDPAGGLRHAERPLSAEDWVAVAVAVTVLRKDGATIAYHRPEVLRGVFEEIARGGRAPDVAALAQWLSP
jgi:HEXXH motif-containing protein